MKNTLNDASSPEYWVRVEELLAESAAKRMAIEMFDAIHGNVHDHLTEMGDHNYRHDAHGFMMENVINELKKLID